MPAMLDDPTGPQHFRRSGPQPHPLPNGPLPPNVIPRQVTLRDRITPATILPFNSPTQLPASLISYLCDEFAREVERGDTYPMIEPMPLESFGPYWFGVFGTVMLAGDLETATAMIDGTSANEPDWSKACLGSFYTKPNYPGRSSHICNAGFLVTDAARNKGIGRLLGEAYLEWAPKLGYSYSVFNLVYETNVASCRIWDSLGFKRIGKVPKCGNLRSYPDQLVDAVIYGRELGTEGEDLGTEERFDKIRYYLTHNAYPQGADRAEKSRLRSAATHYRLVPSTDPDSTESLLMLKDKEVVSDPARQYEIAKDVHMIHQHGGINKTTATIAERFHWVRIKETVSAVIRNCPDCRDASTGRPLMGVVVEGGPVQPNAASSSTGHVSLQSLTARRRGSATSGPMNDVKDDATHQPQAGVTETASSPNSNNISAAGRLLSLHGHFTGTQQHSTDAQTISPHALLQTYPVDPQLMATSHSGSSQRQRPYPGSQTQQSTQTYNFVSSSDMDVLMQYNAGGSYGGSVDAEMTQQRQGDEAQGAARGDG